MCGIIGYFSDGDHEVDLKSATQELKHRGPDGDGVFYTKDRKVGLGHTRLSIIDVSEKGKQPFSSENNDAVITFNGEIYNYKDLKKDLLAKQHKFRSTSDTEVLLNLFIEKGKIFVEDLNGIFSFAIWNKEDKTIMLSRDILGVKPLYYFQNDNYFAFASEIKALLTIIPDKHELDYDSIYRYLSFLWSPGEGTPIKGVKKLHPGESFIIKDGKVVERWIARENFNPKNKQNKKDSIKGVRNHLQKSVHSQMVSDVPVGAFLSGGLDSSSIVNFAREIDPKIQCFSIDIEGGFGEGFEDDLPFAKKVASHLDVPLEVVNINPKFMSSHLESMVEQLDEPLTDLAPLNLMFICELAKNQGIKVLLSGAGGDDVFSGYRRHTVINYQKYWDWMPDKILRYGESFSNKINTEKPLNRRISSLLKNISLKGDYSLISFFRWSKESDLNKVLSSEFKLSVNSDSLFEPMFSYLENIQQLSKIDKTLALERRFFLADHNLNYTDKMSMKEGVEVRVPFLDIDLINFANSIPSKYKQKGRQGKWVLKKAMEPFLPRDIIYRSKSGFGAPVRRWIKNELSDLVREILFSDKFKNRGLFELREIENLYKNNLKGKVDASYLILSIIIIEIWCRRYLDQNVKFIK